MICDKCGFDMPASCCVIGNYWDCTGCKESPKDLYMGVSNFDMKVQSGNRDAFLKVEEEIVVQGTGSNIMELVKAEHEAWLLDTIDRLERSLWASPPKVEPILGSWLTFDA